MADNSYKVNKSLNLNPQATLPSNPTSGDLYYDATSQSFAYYNNSAWSFLDSIIHIDSISDMTSVQFNPPVVQHAVVKLGGAGGRLYGMTSSYSGKRLILYNACSGNISLYHNSGADSANNRIMTPSSSNMELIPGEVAQFIYDGGQSRWLLVSVGSGAGAYAAAKTSANGVVTLNQTPPSSTSPKVPIVDGSEQVIAQGISRGAYGNGALFIGAGATDTSVTISKSGATTTVAGALSVSGGDTSVPAANDFKYGATRTNKKLWILPNEGFGFTTGAYSGSGGIGGGGYWGFDNSGGDVWARIKLPEGAVIKGFSVLMRASIFPHDGNFTVEVNSGLKTAGDNANTSTDPTYNRTTSGTLTTAQLNLDGLAVGDYAWRTHSFAFPWTIVNDSHVLIKCSVGGGTKRGCIVYAIIVNWEYSKIAPIL